MKRILIALTLIVTVLFTACTKDKDENPFYAKLVAHDWKVSSYVVADTVDITADFDGYKFAFNEDGSAKASKGSSNSVGTYTIQEDDPSAIEMTIGFLSASSPLDKMIGLWDTNENDFTDAQLIIEQEIPAGGVARVTLVTY